MFRLIPDFSFGLVERRNPFDRRDGSEETLLFLYVTGRGEFSYLFEVMSEHVILSEAEKSIPRGYTQLWLLERILAVQPSSKTERQGIRSSHRRAVEALRRDAVQAGLSYVLLAENGHNLGWSPRLPAAENAARAIVAGNHGRIVIALLRADITWH